MAGIVAGDVAGDMTGDMTGMSGAIFAVVWMFDGPSVAVAAVSDEACGIADVITGVLAGAIAGILAGRCRSPCRSYCRGGMDGTSADYSRGLRNRWDWVGEDEQASYIVVFADVAAGILAGVAGNVAGVAALGA